MTLSDCVAHIHTWRAQRGACLSTSALPSLSSIQNLIPVTCVFLLSIGCCIHKGWWVLGGFFFLAFFFNAFSTDKEHTHMGFPFCQGNMQINRPALICIKIRYTVIYGHSDIVFVLQRLRYSLR